MSDEAGPPPRAPRTWFLIAAVVAITVVAFLPSLPGGWIYDDRPLIADNPHAHSLAQWHWWLTHDFWSVDAETFRVGARIIYWRPLISASYAVDWTVGGGSPLMFHVTNLITHALVALLAFIVLRRWTGSILAAALGAALFAVHPTKAESVAWIAGRTDVLCMIAMFVATIGIGRRLRGERGGFALEVAGTVGAYLCKEQAIVMPAFVLIELWLARGKPAIDASFVKRSVRAVAPQLLLALAYLGIRALVLPVRTEVGESPGLIHHSLAVLDSVGRYVSLSFAPVNLTIQQGLKYSLARPTHSLPYMLLGAASLAGLGSVAWFGRKRWPGTTLAIIFFAVTIAPTANIIYGGMNTLVAERFLYLPMFGAAFGLAECLTRLHGRQARALAAAVLIATLLFAVQSARRSADYSDEERFWTRELKINPDSREARNFQIAAATDAHHYRTALRELLDLSRRINEVALGIEFPVQIAEVSSQLVPDLATDDLRAIDSFVAHALARDVSTATLAVRGIHLDVAVQHQFMSKGIDRISVRLWGLRANIASRLGDHVAAQELISHALIDCPECPTAVTTYALVLGRAGKIDQGLEVLERARSLLSTSQRERVQAGLESARTHRDAALRAAGPAAIQERASELAALELWGAAYTVLAPYKDEIKGAPGVAPGFAELAFRAGNEAVAREVLATLMAPDKIQAQLDEWAREMGWLD